MRRMLAVFVAPLLTNALLCAPAAVATQAGRASGGAAEVRAGVERLGVGPGARVEGHNLSAGAKVAIGAGVVAAAVILFVRWAGQFK